MPPGKFSRIEWKHGQCKSLFEENWSLLAYLEKLARNMRNPQNEAIHKYGGMLQPMVIA